MENVISRNNKISTMHNQDVMMQQQRRRLQDSHGRSLLMPVMTCVVKLATNVFVTIVDTMKVAVVTCNNNTKKKKEKKKRNKKE